MLLGADRGAGLANDAEVCGERVAQAPHAGIAGKLDGGRQIDAQIAEERGPGQIPRFR